MVHNLAQSGVDFQSSYRSNQVTDSELPTFDGIVGGIIGRNKESGQRSIFCAGPKMGGPDVLVLAAASFP